MSNPLERYQKLGFEDAVTRIHRYPTVCKELSLILRKAYDKLPKNLQSIIFQHTLAAFRHLPEMQTRGAVYAAQSLLQSAEAALPKQKRTLAVAEFKHAKVALRRRDKSRHEGESTSELPHDALLHIFSYLDMQTLVSIGLVCWSWNLAANDNNLWQSQYALLFGGNHNCLKVKEWQEGCVGENRSSLMQQSIVTTDIDWKEAFKRAYTGNSSKRLTFDRVYCIQCKAIVWHDNWKCSNRDCRLRFENQRMIPISPDQVVEYLLNDSLSVSSLSDSDSESDEGLISKLWAVPKHIGRYQNKVLM